MESTQNTSLFQLNVDANTGYTLKSAASWARVLAILGIIFGIIFIGMGVYMQSLMNKAGSPFDDYGYGGGRSNIMASAGTIGMVMYIIIGLITIIGSIFALNFGNKISTALKTNDQNTLRSGFAGLRNYFAYWTILMIIGLLLCIIGIAGGATAGM